MISFLYVLKIIGTVLLWILLIVLILAVLILFCPIRYNVHVVLNDPEGSSEKPDADRMLKKLKAEVRCHWLLYLIRGGISYPDRTDFIVYILFWRLNITRMLRRHKDSAEKRQQPANKAQKMLDQAREADDLAKYRRKSFDNGAAAECAGESGNDANSEQTDHKTENSGDTQNAARGAKRSGRLYRFSRLLRQALQDPVSFMECKAGALCTRIKKAVSNIRWVLKLLANDSTHRAAGTLMQKGRKLLSAVVPHSWFVKGTVGLGGPEKEGQLLEVIGALYPLIGGHTDIIPEFELYRFDLKAGAKGRIYIFRVLILALQVIRDKDLRRLKERVLMHTRTESVQ